MRKSCFLNPQETLTINPSDVIRNAGVNLLLTMRPEN